MREVDKYALDSTDLYGADYITDGGIQLSFADAETEFEVNLTDNQAEMLIRFILDSWDARRLNA